MNKYINAKLGRKWTPTLVGLEQGKVRAKYELDSKSRQQYEKQVPASWVEKGYVQEVDR